jgi:3-dehydroquinate dehydratase-2
VSLQARPRRLLLVNGPNLNLLGTREPAIYGSTTLADVEQLVSDTAAELGYEVTAVQSNHEGMLLEAIHAARITCAAVVINPGALTHTSIALRDALSGVGLPVGEVHISNVHRREEFRHHSYVSGIAEFVVAGAGVHGYAFAVQQLIRTLGEPAAAP